MYETVAIENEALFLSTRMITERSVSPVLNSPNVGHIQRGERTCEERSGEERMQAREQGEGVAWDLRFG